MTSPITNAHFHSRVLALLSSSITHDPDRVNGDEAAVQGVCPIQVGSLSPADSYLTPGETLGQVIATASSWTDVCSSDPVIADISRQILRMEVKYAAFCGISHVLMPSPRLPHPGSHDAANALVQYARMMLEMLTLGPYLQFYVWTPMIDLPGDASEAIGDLAAFSRGQAQEDKQSAPRLDLFASWEAWDFIRSLCKYHPRLSVGKQIPLPALPASCKLSIPPSNFRLSYLALTEHIF